MLLRRTALHLGVAEGPVDTATAPGIVSSIHSHSSTQLKSSKRYLGMFSALYSALRTSLHTTEPTHPTQFSSSMPEKMKEKVRCRPSLCSSPYANVCWSAGLLDHLTTLFASHGNAQWLSWSLGTTMVDDSNHASYPTGQAK